MTPTVHTRALYGAARAERAAERRAAWERANRREIAGEIAVCGVAAWALLSGEVWRLVALLAGLVQ